MTTEDMKLTKFKTMVDDLYGRFDICQVYTENEGDSYFPSVKLLLGEGHDRFLDALICYDVAKKSQRAYPCEATMDSLIEVNRKVIASHSWPRINGAGQTIFLALLALAISNELYNEKLEIVSDFAYLIGFKEDMMEDWLNAVKKYLLAEDINPKDMKTSEARIFFTDLRKAGRKV